MANNTNDIERIGKSELIKDVATRTGVSQQKVSAVISGFLDAIVAALNDGKKVTLIKFGTFQMRERKERTMRDMRTGKSILVPARKLVSFKRSKTL